MRELIEQARAERRHLLEPEAKALVRGYGVHVPEFAVATTQDQLAGIADRLGFPLAMKVVSPKILHKTEAGLVRLGLADKAGLLDAYNALLERAGTAEVRGVLVERMEPPGLEMIVGMRRDPVFGPVLTCGLGGIYVEALHDVSYRVTPVDAGDAREMLGELRCRALLQGVRGERPRDVEALVSTILAVARLALELRDIEEIDLNPVLLYERGAIAVDARILLGEEDHP